jgi:hypothetical protein
MNFIKRLFGIEDDQQPDASAEPMTEPKIDFSFRIYWTKISFEQHWDLDRIRTLRRNVEAVTQQPDFQKNLIDRRYVVEGLDDLAHSGASLLALLEVLAALETSNTDTEGDP